MGSVWLFPFLLFYVCGVQWDIKRIHCAGFGWWWFGSYHHCTASSRVAYSDKLQHSSQHNHQRTTRDRVLKDTHWAIFTLLLLPLNNTPLPIRLRLFETKSSLVSQSASTVSHTAVNHRTPVFRSTTFTISHKYTKINHHASHTETLPASCPGPEHATAHCEEPHEPAGRGVSTVRFDYWHGEFTLSFVSFIFLASRSCYFSLPPRCGSSYVPFHGSEPPSFFGFSLCP